MKSPRMTGNDKHRKNPEKEAPTVRTPRVRASDKKRKSPKTTVTDKKFSRQNKLEFARTVTRLQMYLNLPWTREDDASALSQIAEIK